MKKVFFTFSLQPVVVGRKRTEEIWLIHIKYKQEIVIDSKANFCLSKLPFDIMTRLNLLEYFYENNLFFVQTIP